VPFYLDFLGLIPFFFIAIAVAACFASLPPIFNLGLFTLDEKGFSIRLFTFDLLTDISFFFSPYLLETSLVAGNFFLPAA